MRKIFFSFLSVQRFRDKKEIFEMGSEFVDWMYNTLYISRDWIFIYLSMLDVSWSVLESCCPTLAPARELEIPTSNTQHDEL